MRTLRVVLLFAMAAVAPHAPRLTGAAQGGAEQAMTRERALRGLEGCSRRTREKDCDDYAADFLINAYWRGDRGARVLRALLGAWPYGDGAMSEGLGTFYGQMLQREPRVFVQAIAGRPARERQDLCAAAGGTDGSGMSEVVRREAKAGLRRIAAERRSRLAPVARACWASASAADRRVKSQNR